MLIYVTLFKYMIKPNNVRTCFNFISLYCIMFPAVVVAYGICTAVNHNIVVLWCRRFKKIPSIFGTENETSGVA